MSIWIIISSVVTFSRSFICLENKFQPFQCAWIGLQASEKQSACILIFKSLDNDNSCWWKINCTLFAHNSSANKTESRLVDIMSHKSIFSQVCKILTLNTITLTNIFFRHIANKCKNLKPLLPNNQTMC